MARWATDYFLKCWDADSSRLWAQVGDGGADHSKWDRVEDMTIARPSFSIEPGRPGSDLAGETAAAMAAASLAFQDDDPAYAAELLEAAKQIFDFADTHRGKYSDSVSQASPFYT